MQSCGFLIDKEASWQFFVIVIGSPRATSFLVEFLDLQLHFAVLLVVVLALVFFAIVGLASTADSTPDAAAAAPAIVDAGGNNDLIGTGDEGDSEAAPVGGPVPEGVFTPVSPAQSPNSGATVLEVSSVAAGAVAVAATLFF
ncbi:hypothetical protein F0562_033224 [Nyssa sinensis]|uniref:Uncharacterized protein n=1 Tax=Nyssa sinensis TaxID=561372 RepID=A0A5J5AQF1_9ASTE|nr:hypothetical protein F0562_033224 [Nyssa sinensis]